MRVAVFTGSGEGPESHRRAAADFARRLAESGVGIVYGGGRVGLMGVVADAALAAGGEVVGVMPRHLADQEIAHPDLTRLDIVTTMHDRKARMADLADAFVALPGGAGTLEELFEVWTWGQLGLHSKPTALLDVDGFFRLLIDHLHLAVESGYINPVYLKSLGVVGDADDFLRFVTGYEHPARKWSDRGRGVSSDGGPRTESAMVGWIQLRGGRLLTVRGEDHNHFALPGGVVEPGETFEQALERGVKEDLGLRLTDLRQAFSVPAQGSDPTGKDQPTMYCYHARADGSVRPGRDIAEFRWLSASEAEYATPPVQQVLARLNPELTAPPGRSG